MKLLNMIVGGALIASVGTVSAAEVEPLTLTEMQMDRVTGAAGAVAGANAFAAAAGFLDAFSAHETFTEVLVLDLQGPPGGQIPVFTATSVSASAAAAF